MADLYRIFRELARVDSRYFVPYNQFLVLSPTPTCGVHVKSRSQHTVAQLGIRATMSLLSQLAANAAQFANLVQEPVNAQDQASPEQKPGEAFASALTNADIATETYIAVELTRLFGDVSFYGEEAAQDRVSPYIPADRPYLVTADPIDGTLYYKQGLPIFATILTLCQNEGEMLGSVIALPAKRILFTAYKEQGTCSLRKTTLSETGILEPGEAFRLAELKRPRRVALLGNEYLGREQPLLEADIQPVFPFRDFRGQLDWEYCLASLLLGESVGVLLPEAQLIDAGAVAFAATCGGGVWRHHGLNHGSKRYAGHLAATNVEIADILEEVRG